MDVIGGGDNAMQAGTSSVASGQILSPIISSNGGTHSKAQVETNVVSSTPAQNKENFKSVFENLETLHQSAEMDVDSLIPTTQINSAPSITQGITSYLNHVKIHFYDFGLL